MRIRWRWWCRNVKCKRINVKMEGVIDEEWMFCESEKPYNIRHRCFHFAKDVILFVSEVECLQIHNSILDQLIRSATSIGANSVEGGAGSSKKDFIKFFAVKTVKFLNLDKDSGIS